MTSRSLMAEPSIKPNIVVREVFEDVLKSQELFLATKRAVQAKECATFLLSLFDDEKMEEFIAFAQT